MDSLRENAFLIRNYFSPDAETEEYLNAQLLLFSAKKVLIGVHMRRGDYKSWRNGEFYFTDDIYKQYMDQLFKALGAQATQFILFYFQMNRLI